MTSSYRQWLHRLERRTGIARSRVQTPLTNLIFSGFYIRNCINCVHNCEDHTLLICVVSFTFFNRTRSLQRNAVVTVLAFHQCRVGSISCTAVVCGLILLVLYSALRGFSLSTPVFSANQKPSFDLISFFVIQFDLPPRLV